MTRKRRRFDRPSVRRPVHRVPGAQYADLDAYIDATNDTLESIAEHVGSTASYLSRIKNGHCCPRPRLATRIAKYTGVPPQSFILAYLRRHGTKSRRLQRSA